MTTDTHFNEPVEDNEVERYELREPARYRFSMDRREFVQFVGTGLLFTISAGRAAAQAEGPGGSRAPQASPT